MVHYIVEDTIVNDEGVASVNTVPFTDHDAAIDWADYLWGEAEIDDIDMYVVDHNGYVYDMTSRLM